MRVRELITELNKCHQDCEVVISRVIDGDQIVFLDIWFVTLDNDPQSSTVMINV